MDKLTRRKHLVLGIPVLIVACSSARGGDDRPIAERSPAASPPSPQPSFGEAVEQPDAPPPISGGTLATDSKVGIAVAADSDRDRVYVVDLDARTVRHTVQLSRKTEPGRVALDGSNRAHVALRGTGELATIDLATGAVSVRAACTAPRGVTFDPKGDSVYVACGTGELLTFPTAGGPASARVTMGRDLRDVVLVGGRVFATRFRTAHLVEVNRKASAADLVPADQALGDANLAWRAVAPPNVDPDAEPAMPAVVAQEPTREAVRTEPGGYGSGGSPEDSCGPSVGIVTTRLFVDISHGKSVKLPSAVLPVDLATNGREFVVVAAGNAHTSGLPQLFVVDRSQVTGRMECITTVQGNVPGQAVAAAFDHRDELIVQTREPAALFIMTEDRRRPWKSISLAADSREDTGHAIFHSNSGGNIACASCHAEGADDGHAWEFVGMGARRTPSLLGTTKDTEPFHWSGDMKDLSTLVDHVFVERMSGPRIDKHQVDMLGKFIFTLPAPGKLRLEKDVPARGKELFEGRCVTCHSGSIMTNNRSFDVGTGGVFQVPSLVGVGWRAPFLHTGCAKTLFDRFDPSCGGGLHGDTKDLGKDQIADIVSYLETL